MKQRIPLFQADALKRCTWSAANEKALTGENVEHLGIYSFGAAAHIIAQVAVYEGKKIYAFTRPGDTDAQEFARSLGAIWAGDSTDTPPHPLDAAMIFAPVGSLIPEALGESAKGGVVVSGGIHMKDILSVPYSILWDERVVRSVANLTRRDGMEFFEIAPKVPVRTEVHTWPLTQAADFKAFPVILIGPPRKPWYRIATGLRASRIGRGNWITARPVLAATPFAGPRR